MIRKFECKECGNRFSSDDKGQVICPTCGSDNVDYATVHVPYKYISLILCVSLCVAFLFWADFNSLFPDKIDINPIDTPTVKADTTNATDETSQAELDTELQGLNITIPPTIKGVEKIKIDDDGNYSFIVKTGHAPEKGYCVQILDVKTNEVIAKSDNGEFKNIPYSKNNGRYYAWIVNASTNESLSEKTEITGFVKVESISKKLSIAELQDLIDRQDSSLKGHDNEYLSPVCKIKYTNLSKDSYAPVDFGEVYEMFQYNTWEAVEVTSVEYDKNNHITSVTLKVKPRTE